MIQQLPLFPLGTVLYPGSTLNLHIFEERYRSMIGKCIEKDSPFGVIYLRSGDEVVEGRALARPAETASIGTVAEISANVRLEDGRYLLNATGVRRFRVQYLLQRAPYLVAAVIELPEEGGPQVEAAAGELRAAYRRYWQAVAVASDAPIEVEDLAEDPATMAYQLAEKFHVPYDQKQRWLETELTERLRGLAAELRGELAILPPAAGLGNMN
ncbi:LON peptidase substrate-binding domain-containing protein [Oscillochloris sp. ZM17-4]|uniref:LON peptidase substrate-binding domain-containing protein n=1 Tax=Oscillochloris sp. ZM17-4 TaxID=2866714 RepID=UPI001C73B593|nr:LON peptidase substrate-binding domain-containing protein [Oscillochloris sp. ZM17-4]MBX0330336.1 LON peptidase substrate-binding domain-containing protein [Oscillochloris sp. ZM17-4]